MADSFKYFKYRAINKNLISSLVTPSLWFASPDTLNDPFDCKVNAGLALKKAAQITDGKRRQILETIADSPVIQDFFGDKFSTTIGIGAFSLTEREPLMWSHYADQHRGVCVSYEFPRSYLETEWKGSLIGTDHVKYDLKKFVTFLAHECKFESKDDFIETFLPAYLTWKSYNWHYEREARMLMFKPGLVEIPGRFVRKICFGLNTPQADIDLVVKLAKAHCGCARFARAERDMSRFGLKIVPLEA